LWKIEDAMILLIIFITAFIATFLHLRSKSDKEIDLAYKEIREDNCRPHSWVIGETGMTCSRCGKVPEL